MTKSLLLTFVGLCFSFQSIAQCCSAGNPASSGGSLGMDKNSLSISASYLYSYSDTYFEDDYISDYEYLENTEYHFSVIGLNYGLTEKVKLSTELGYYIDKSLKYGFIDQTKNATGLADATLSVQYLLYSNTFKKFSVAPSFKLTMPVGEFDQMDNNIILPIDIQPSSGNFKYTPSILLNKKLIGTKLSVSMFASVEFSQKIITDITDYKYGNLYNLSYTFVHNTTNKLNLGTQLNALYRDNSIDKGTTIEATGGSYIIVQPQVSYRLNHTMGFNTSVNIPVYRYVNGPQMTNKYLFTFGFSSSLGNRKPKAINPENWGSNINELNFYVDGICGMCKDRIEGLAYKVKGVKWAEWDLESKSLTVKFQDELNEEKLAKAIAKGGHDNWMLKADEKAYQNLHSCCKYRSEH